MSHVALVPAYPPHLPFDSSVFRVTHPSSSAKEKSIYDTAEFMSSFMLSFRYFVYKRPTKFIENITSNLRSWLVEE